jgi:hypothetical protein
MEGKVNAHVPVKPGPDDPIRLKVAAALAFPDGSMTVSGLRREAARGRLAIDRVAGKDYTTLRAIEEMRALCRVPPKAPVCGSGPHGTTMKDITPRPGSSGTEDGNLPLAAARMIVKELKERYPTTSPASTRRRGATVIPLSSRSST